MLDEGFTVQGNEVTGLFEKKINNNNQVTLDSLLETEFKMDVEEDKKTASIGNPNRCRLTKMTNICRLT